MPAMCQTDASRCHLFPKDELLMWFRVHYCQDARCQVAASPAKLPAAKLHGALPFTSEESDEEESENVTDKIFGNFLFFSFQFLLPLWMWESGTYYQPSSFFLPTFSQHRHSLGFLGVQNFNSTWIKMPNMNVSVSTSFFSLVSPWQCPASRSSGNNLQGW